jgi:alkylhydroperoxidase family enzyme
VGLCAIIFPVSGVIELARLPLQPSDPDDPIVAQVFETFKLERRPPIALYRALAHAPRMLQAYSVLARGLRNEAETERALREIVILRTAQLVGSTYEWAHHVPMAKAAGVRDDQIRTLRDWRQSAAFDPQVKTVLQCVDEIDSLEVTDASFEALVGELGSSGAVEIVLLASFYQSVARTIQALGLEVEQEYEQYLDTW